MAVKLMPVAVPGAEIEKPVAPSEQAEKPKQPRKRRRAAVYDADGHEVLITLKCLKCNRMHPLSNFGLRKMADGAIRNQPWCRECRGASSPKKKKDEVAEAEVQAQVDAQQPPATPVEAAAQTVATELAPPTAAVPQVNPAAPQYGVPMAVVPLTAEQVLRALAPQHPAPVQPAAPAQPAATPVAPVDPSAPKS